MPEFLGRPNLPNALAQTLVQLAAQQQDPAAEAFKQIGKMADTFTAYQLQQLEAEQKTKAEEKKAEVAHGRAKELKQMDTEADIFKTLMSQDRIVEGMIQKKPEPASLVDLSKDLGASGAPRSQKAPLPGAPMSKEIPDTSVRTESGMVRNPKGTPLREMGVNMEGNVIPSKEKIEITQGIVDKYKLPADLLGKSATLDQILNLRKQDQIGARGAGGSGGRTDVNLMAKAISAVNADPEMAMADGATKAAAYDEMYDNLSLSVHGGTPKAPVKAPEPEKKKPFSLLGWAFGSGGAGAPPSKDVASGETEESIRAQYQAKKISKEEARKRIVALRSKSKSK